jgi:hypothetical protein
LEGYGGETSLDVNKNFSDEFSQRLILDVKSLRNFSIVILR